MFALTAMTAHSALLLTFTETGGDVVLTYTGSVDMSNASFSDTGWNIGGIGNEVQTSGVEWNPAVSSGVVGGDFYAGVDLLAGNLTNATFSGTADAGNTGNVFNISNANFTIGQTNNDGSPDFGVFAPSGFITFSGETFVTMGLNAHTPDTLIDLWGAQATPGSHELVQFTVSAVPEPSTTALLGLGGLALILRRSK
jgi:hypothetical protein